MKDDHTTLRVCPRCGLAKDTRAFYLTSSYCKPCHMQWSLQNRKRPERRARERVARNTWLKQHPEVNRRNVAAYRIRQKVLHPPQVIPPDRALVREAVVRLRVTKQRVQQLIDRGQLAAVRERGRWLIDRAALERMVEERGISVDNTREAKADAG